MTSFLGAGGGIVKHKQVKPSEYTITCSLVMNKLLCGSDSISKASRVRRNRPN